MSIKNAIMRTLNMGVLKVRKRSPEILLATSLTSGALALGLAVKQTLTIQPVLEDWNEWMEDYKAGLEMSEERDESLPPFPEETAQKIMVGMAVQTGLKLVKHYSLPLAFAGLSAAATLGMYKVWNARYTAVVAAATGLQETLNKYREKLREQLGEDADKELLARTVDEDRETKEDPQTKQPVRQPQKMSKYARIFDESSTYYKRNAGDNLSFLIQQQSLANRMLSINGCMFLNEVYDMLGFPRTQAGSIVGWLFDPGKPEQIDFGFWDLGDEAKRAFINGWEKSVLLDFNVDGIIFDKI